MAVEDTVLTDDAVMAAQTEQDNRSSMQIISDTLAQYGLESLSPKAFQMLLAMLEVKGCDCMSNCLKLAWINSCPDTHIKES